MFEGRRPQDPAQYLERVKGDIPIGGWKILR